MMDCYYDDSGWISFWHNLSTFLLHSLGAMTVASYGAVHTIDHQTWNTKGTKHSGG